MRISVIDPVSLAIERTRFVLFHRFDFVKWITLGFCAWLAGIGEGSSAPNFNMRFPLGGGPGAPAPGAPRPEQKAAQPGAHQPAAPNDNADFKETMDWVWSNIEIIVGVGAALILLLVVLSLLLTWLKARGTFMFLDGVVHNRGAVAAPWREYAREGNSLFRFIFFFGIVVSVLALAILVLGAVLAWPDLQAGRFGEHAVLALALVVPLFVANVVFSGLVHVALIDFVVPIMYLRRVGTMTAWGEFRSSILTGHAGTLILYLLFKIVLGLGVGVVAVVATCATCCIAGLPFIGTVILLPLPVFQRSYSLYFLEQFGADWQVFPSASKPQGLIFEDLPPSVT